MPPSFDTATNSAVVSGIVPLSILINKTVSVKVNVKLHPETVLVEKEALLLTAGSSGKMSAKVYPEKAAEKGVTWKFKDDKAVAGFSLSAPLRFHSDTMSAPRLKRLRFPFPV